VKEGRQDSELPVVNRGSDEVEDPDVEEEKRKEVLEQRHNHGRTKQARVTDPPQHRWNVRPDEMVRH